MWTRLTTARDGYMSPLERALVLGVSWTLVASFALFNDDSAGVERIRGWELVLSVVSLTILGLLSSLGIWLRAPAYAIFGTGIFVGGGLLANRANMLDAGVVVSSLLSTFLQGASIGLVDLPAWRREWAAKGTSVEPDKARWASYYGMTALAWTCLLFASDALCDVLVSNVLPSPRLVKSPTVIGIGFVALFIGAAILMTGRELPALPRSLRIVVPSLWAALVVIVFIVQSEILNIGIASIKGAVPAILDQPNARESVQLWTSNPAAALRDRAAEAAMLSAILAPVSIALFAMWDNARAQGKRSLTATGVVVLLTLVLSSFLGIAIGTLIEVMNGSQVISYGNRIGLPVGFVAGLVSVLLWLRWTQDPQASGKSTSTPYASGVADLPEHVANAVDASRQAMP